MIDRNYSQMFSYYKTLDICENNITFTFFGFNDEFQKIRDFLISNYFEKSTFIYKKSNDEQYILICKNQTCSEKLKDIEVINLIRADQIDIINSNYNCKIKNYSVFAQILLKE